MAKVIFSLLLLLTSCAFRIKDDEALRKQAADQLLETLVKSTTSERVSTEEIRVELEDDEEFNKFQLIAKWPSRAYRAELKINDEVIESVEHSYVKRNIEGHKGLLNVSVTLFNELGAIIGRKDFDIKFHNDLKISEPTSMKGEFEANRLLITTGGRIITNGQSLTIKAKKIIIEDTYNPGAAFRAEDAHILTVLPGTKSLTTEGKPSHADIKIQADEAIGDLRVALIGFDGNDGVTPIVKHPPAAAGKNGTSGESQDIGRYCTDDRGRPCRSEIICKVEPQAAEPGLKGAKGIDAAPGQDGGDTGSLTIDIRNTENFTAKIITLPGEGGKSGLRGEGGPGGPPGITPRAAPGCRQPKPASSGDQGPYGNYGKDGISGAIGFIDTKATRAQISKASDR